jgi:sodium/hydrogen exchanger 8
MNFTDQNVTNEDGDIYYASTSTSVIDAEEVHNEDAYAAVFLNVTLIGCVLLAYFIKKNRIYYLPESAAAMIMGMIIGAIARFFVRDLSLYQFSPEFFFFVLLPPIIFEAGYSLDRNRFFENIGAITMFAMFGTITSTFIVGYCTFYAGRAGWITGISQTNPMEALLFGALISAVDPVATLSIMGSPELHCNQMLYSIVFGESVLNDAIAVVLFKTFHRYYDPDAPNLTADNMLSAFLDFFTISFFSILVGVALGLLTSYIYKNTSIRDTPKLESTLLFLFCYCCYATAEAMELSGIMALFFNGVVLSHYNSYNLSEDSLHSTEQIFETLATIAETIVFLYMGMGFFTSKLQHWNLGFSLFAMLFCVIGRIMNIFPLSFLSNLCRKTSNRITWQMQFVLCFAGLRGAIAFALATNMPGPNAELYTTVTLTICGVSTVVCGGFTERILGKFGMKENSQSSQIQGEEEMDENSLDNQDEEQFALFSEKNSRDISLVYDGMKGLWANFDYNYLRPRFGGWKNNSTSPCNKRDNVILGKARNDGLGHYELGHLNYDDDDDTDDGDIGKEAKDDLWQK